jgi:hypothetical protein
MSLDDFSNEKRTHFDVSDSSEVLGIEQTDLSFIRKKDLALVFQRRWINRMKLTVNSVAVPSSPIIWIMKSVIVDRAKARDEKRSSVERAERGLYPSRGRSDLR